VRWLGVGLAGLLAVPVLAIGGLGSGLQDSSAASGAALGPEEAAAAVLSHPRIHLRPQARRDVEAGIVDPRVLQILLVAASSHDLGSVGPLVSGHSYYVAGTNRASNHAFGRAVDIPVVDGEAVSVTNGAALDLARLLGTLAPPLRPDELGAPWKLEIEGVSTFTRSHGDHLHAGFGA
jgi:hypothetical protein